MRGPGGVGPEGYLGTVWTGEELVVWNVQSDEAAAYDLDTDNWNVLPAPEMNVDNGALRWDGENVYAFGTTVFNPPNSEEMSTSRLVGDEWERLPETEFAAQGFAALARRAAVGARPGLVGLTRWIDDPIQFFPVCCPGVAQDCETRSKIPIWITPRNEV